MGLINRHRSTKNRVSHLAEICVGAIVVVSGFAVAMHAVIITFSDFTSFSPRDESGPLGTPLIWWSGLLSLTVLGISSRCYWRLTRTH